MRSYLTRRLGMMLLTLLGLVVVVFCMSQVLPGDPARTAAGRNASAEQIAAARERLGLDEPVFSQFTGYLGRLFQGDLGTSVVTHQPIAHDIAHAFPSSLELVLAAMVINIVVAVPLGVLAAVYRGSLVDVTARIVATLAAAFPVFWLGLMLQYLFGAQLGAFPLTGETSFGIAVPRVTGMVTVDALLAGDLNAFGDAVWHLVLPALTLAASFIAVIARTMRSTMMTALNRDYILLAQAKGVRGLRLIVRHALRNSLIPSSTIIGMQLGWMLGSTVLVESIFGRSGIGAYAVNAVVQSDLYAVIAVVLIIGVVFVIANFVVDLVHLWLDPRLRTVQT